MSPQLPDTDRVLPVAFAGGAAPHSRLGYSARTSDRLDDMQRRHHGQHDVDALRQTDAVGQHERRRHRVRHGRSGAAHHDVPERRFHKNKWREAVDGDGGLQVSRAVALSSYFVRAAHHAECGRPGAAAALRMDVPDQPRRLLSVRNRSAKVVAHYKSSTDVRMVLRRTLLAGFGRVTHVHVSGHVPSARLVRPEVPVLAERADRTRTDQCAAALRER